jgi:integrase
MAKGSIIPRKVDDNGNVLTWRVMVSGFKNGERIQVTKTAHSIRQAEKIRTALRVKIDNDTYHKPSKLTTGDFLREWLSSYCKPNLTAQSLARYSSIVRVHLLPAFETMPLSQLQTSNLQKLYSEKLDSGLSARSVRYIHVVIHKALNTALKWDKVTRNVADGTDIPSAHSPEMQTWNEKELTQFLATAQTTHYYPVFYMALFTGARRGELLALRWCDVDLVRGQMSVNRSLTQIGTRFVYNEPKTEKSRRTIALPQSAILMLKQLREATEHTRSRFGKVVSAIDLIFSLDGESPLRPNTVSRMWDTIAARAGVKHIRFHDGRHTHASLMLKDGVPLKVVSERLGHSSIVITGDVYSHILPGMQEAAAQRFDALVTRQYNELTASKK